MKTKQQIFDVIYAHAQKMQPSLCDFGPFKGSCAYRGKDNARCFIGCLIPDELYDPIIENVGVAILGLPDIYKSPGLTKLTEIMRKIGTDIDVDFLKELQSVHDNNQPSKWNELLYIIADKYELTVCSV